tara:strand:- start:172 stop:528 length:357 start_codon:yes stop_codon:yes gene_type:complete
MKIVIIDTNVWLLGIDVIAILAENLNLKFKPAVLNGTLIELEKIKEGQRARYARQAALALKIIKAKKILVISSEGIVDDVLVEHSKKGDLVLTQDRGLKIRLSKPYLTIRQQKYVVMV